MSQMRMEAIEASTVIAKQLDNNAELWAQIASEIQKRKPRCIITVARGSSDHAATYGKYLFETYCQLPTVSAAPAVVTLYGQSNYLKNTLVVGLSQSGQSPDICEVMQAAKKQGAMTVALVNETESPMADIAEFLVPLHAGPEKAVAATKSYLSTLAALAQMTATISGDSVLKGALDQLPKHLEKSTQCDWSKALPIFEHTHTGLVVSRGYGFSIAQEAALKFKETSAIHTEAFSGAEILHGPFALIKEGLPVLLLAHQDPALDSLLALTEQLNALRAKTLFACPADLIPDTLTCHQILPLPNSLHPVLDPLMSIQACYLMLNDLALKRGRNPDQPENLRKVTKTL